MTNLNDDLSAIDRLIHEPARLAILTALSACQSADFTYMKNLTGLTPGNLSSHLTRLEEVGLVWIDKKIVGKRPHTDIGLTDTGRVAIDRHWQQLDALRRHARENKTGKAKNS